MYWPISSAKNIAIIDPYNNQASLRSVSPKWQISVKSYIRGAVKAVVFWTFHEV